MRRIGFVWIISVGLFLNLLKLFSPLVLYMVNQICKGKHIDTKRKMGLMTNESMVLCIVCEPHKLVNINIPCKPNKLVNINIPSLCIFACCLSVGNENVRLASHMIWALASLGLLPTSPANCTSNSTHPFLLFVQWSTFLFLKRTLWLWLIIIRPNHMRWHLYKIKIKQFRINYQ